MANKLKVCLLGNQGTGKSLFVNQYVGEDVCKSTGTVYSTACVTTEPQLVEFGDFVFVDLPAMNETTSNGVKYLECAREHVADADIVVNFDCNRRGSFNDTSTLVQVGVFDRDKYPVLMNVTNYHWCCIEGDATDDCLKIVKETIAESIGYDERVRRPKFGSLQSFCDNIVQCSWRSREDIVSALEKCSAIASAPALENVYPPMRDVEETKIVLVEGHVPFPVVLLNGSKDTKLFCGSVSQVFTKTDVELTFPHFKIDMSRFLLHKGDDDGFDYHGLVVSAFISEVRGFAFRNNRVNEIGLSNFRDLVYDDIVFSNQKTAKKKLAAKKKLLNALQLGREDTCQLVDIVSKFKDGAYEYDKSKFYDWCDEHKYHDFRLLDVDLCDLYVLMIGKMPNVSAMTNSNDTFDRITNLLKSEPVRCDKMGEACFYGGGKTSYVLPNYVSLDRFKGKIDPHEPWIVNRLGEEPPSKRRCTSFFKQN
jgi:hypothetical protein